MHPDESTSTLDRFLRLFSDVRGGEGFRALLLALNIFLILTAYSILKPIRDALILGEYSAVLKSYLSAGQVVLLVGLVPLYGMIAGRVPRRHLINSVTAFFIGCLALFYILAQYEVPLGIPFFVWTGIFNVMIIAQFWSFANDVYTNDEGERLFPIVGFGMALGAVSGAFITGILIEPLGLYQLMLLAAGLLALGLVITNYVDRRERQRTESHLPPMSTTAEIPAATGEFRIETGEFKLPTEGEVEPEGASAFALVFRIRYLLLIGLLVMLLNWVNTNGGFILDLTIEKAAREAIAAGTAGGLSVKEYIAKFVASFQGVVNLLTLLIQLFLVSRILKYVGAKWAIGFLPVIALGGYIVLAFYPAMSAIRWAKTAENSTDYSLNNTVRAVLFLPTTREQKYKAKQAIDSFFHRAGDVLSAMVVFVGTTYLALSPSGFATVNIVLALVWLVIAVAIGRKYQHLVDSGRPPTMPRKAA